MGGGSDNLAFERKQQEIEDKKQSARDRLNYLFGIGDNGAGRAVDRAPYTSTYSDAPTVHVGNEGEVITEPGGGVRTEFDQAGYDAEAARASAQAEANNPNAGARDSLYQTVRNNAYAAGKTRIDEAQQDAARKLKFELFAKGLAGGSEDVDENARQRRTYTNGLLDLGGKADEAKANFRQGDETTRLNLLQSIDAGMDQGTALSSAVGQLKANSEKATASAIGTDLGNLFNTGSEFYNQSQYARGRQAGLGAADLFAPKRNSGASGVGGAATSGVFSNSPVYG